MMKAPGHFKTLRILFRSDIQRLVNYFRARYPSSLYSAVTIAALGIFFIAVEYNVSIHLFQHIMDQTHLEGLRYVLLAKLLQMVYLVFTILLVYSNIVMSISSFFTSPELDMIHCRPVSGTALFINRYTETFLRSSWMFIAFAVPILVAYGRVLNPSSLFVIQLFYIILPSLILPAALGITTGILLILCFSPRRTQQVFLFLGVFLAVGLVMIFRLMQPEKLIDPIGLEQVNFYLDTLRIPSIRWSPATWASEGIAAFGEGRPALNRTYSLWLWSGAIASIFLAFAVFKAFWWRARSGGRGSEIVDATVKRRRYRRSKPSRFKCSLFYRDMILFNRDPGQWSQLIVIAALVIIYVFNFKNLPYELYGFQYSMSFVSVAATGLILSALLARFGFPAVSTEGKAIWLLQTGPINWRRYLWQKYLFLVIPTMLIGGVLVLFSVRVLDAGTSLIMKCLLAESAIALGCTGLAVGLGAQRPRFDMKDAAMVAVSSTGLYYMITAIVFISVTVTLVVIPDLVRYLSLGYRWLQLIRNSDRTLVWLILCLFTIGTVVVPMERGIRRLRKLSG